MASVIQIRKLEPLRRTAASLGDAPDRFRLEERSQVLADRVPRWRQATAPPTIAARRIKKTLLDARSLDGVDDRPQLELPRIASKLIPAPSSLLRAPSAPPDKSVQNLLQERKISVGAATQRLGCDPFLRRRVCEFNERLDGQSAGTAHEHVDHLVDWLSSLSTYRARTNSGGSRPGIGNRCWVPLLAPGFTTPLQGPEFYIQSPRLHHSSGCPVPVWLSPFSLRLSVCKYRRSPYSHQPFRVRAP